MPRLSERAGRTATTRTNRIEVMVPTPNLLGYPVGERIIIGEAMATAAHLR